ncbi:MAG: MnmC family methyltransferase [Bacteroidota bacterium]|nr:MnmC family methyltransferase [Rhodothermia bacterium]MCS7154248.1 MnmC family methyltransferase [Bacteroidota bacterium]MDW8137004.1 MnmC family methyltransferase [Bacteroidota bacterium]MDW8285125.1 MnmC family methyltransferase [Bacteroidota bacterium]
MESRSPYVPLQTGDGSWTLYEPERGLCFRSRFGACTEARHVFLRGTRLERYAPPWRVLELGLGAGMNFLVTAEAFLQRYSGGLLEYHAIERSPVSPELIEALRYRERLEHPELVEVLCEALARARRHPDRCPQVVLGAQGRVCLYLYPVDWRQAPVPKLAAQAVYHDPFDLKSNPECWTRACFAWLAHRMAPMGILATYGAATAARRAMLRARLIIARLPGVLRKREMTVAAHRAEALAGYFILPYSRFFRSCEDAS